jgi:hypothetical protein
MPLLMGGQAGFDVVCMPGVIETVGTQEYVDVVSHGFGRMILIGLGGFYWRLSLSVARPWFDGAHHERVGGF